MNTPFGDVPVFDSHAHFFSHRFYHSLLEPIRDRFGNTDELAYATMGEFLGIELPKPDPKELAARWVAEMDRHGLERMVLIASAPGDEDSVAAAVRAHPERFTGYFMLDPTKPDAAARARRGLGALGLRGVALFPAMHRFSAAEERIAPVYRAAAEVGAVVFIHFGILRVVIRERLGLPGTLDMRYANPLDVHPAATRFPEVNFQIPHFGCGFYREILMLGELCRNIYLDTSSSNSWARLMPNPLTLRAVFERSLQVYGPRRLLFGTDSTAFPRGWRADVFQDQTRVLSELGVARDDAAAILGGNLARLLGEAP